MSVFHTYSRFRLTAIIPVLLTLQSLLDGVAYQLPDGSVVYVPEGAK